MRLTVYIAAAIILTACTTEIINMDTAREQVKNYYESGAYAEETEQIISDAINKISKMELNENSAVVFDVDDTLLSSYEYTSSIGFGFSYPTWKEWIHDERLTAVPQVKKIYDWLVQKNVNIILLTGRRSDECESTYKNLMSEGFTTFDTLICRPAHESKIDAADYKPAQRKALTAKGYEIIACFGDQWSDLNGEYTGLKVKLPNYLYLID